MPRRIMDHELLYLGELLFGRDEIEEGDDGPSPLAQACPPREMAGLCLAARFYILHLAYAYQARPREMRSYLDPGCDLWR